MASLYDMVEAFQQLGLAMRAAGDEAVKTTEKVKEAARTVETAGGMTRNQGGTGGVNALGSETTALGSPGNAEDMAARMVAALDKAARR